MKIIGGHLCIVLAAAAGGDGGGGEAHHSVDEKNSGNLWGLPKSRPEEESGPRSTEI